MHDVNVQIELALAQSWNDLVGIRDRDARGHARGLVEQAGKCAGNQPRWDNRADVDPEMAGATLADVGYLAGDIAQRKPEIARPREQQRTFRGQLQSFGIAIEQLDLQRILQTPQALAQRGLAEPETLRGAADMSLFGDLLEIFDVTQFHGDNCNSSAHETGAIAGFEKPGDFGTIHGRLQCESSLPVSPWLVF